MTYRNYIPYRYRFLDTEEFTKHPIKKLNFSQILIIDILFSFTEINRNVRKIEVMKSIFLAKASQA